MMKREEKKDLYQSLSMDTIIESCLILMVLLLLTCARHLIVDCTALESPIYPITVSSRSHCCVCQTVSPTRPPTLTPPPFLSCLPSVIRSVTSPVILPCVCELWLFVLKQTWWKFVAFPLPHKKNKNISVAWSVGMISLSGCFLTFSRPPAPPRQTSCIHPFIHPFDIHPSVTIQDWNHQSGLLEEAMVMRRAVVLCRRCSGWRRS